MVLLNSLQYTNFVMNVFCCVLSFVCGVSIYFSLIFMMSVDQFSEEGDDHKAGSDALRIVSSRKLNNKGISPVCKVVFNNFC